MRLVVTLPRSHVLAEHWQQGTFPLATMQTCGWVERLRRPLPIDLHLVRVVAQLAGLRQLWISHLHMAFNDHRLTWAVLNTDLAPRDIPETLHAQLWTRESSFYQKHGI